MTRAYSDGDDVGANAFGPELTAFLQRALQTGSSVLFGCTPSSGSGDLDVDVDDGRVTVDGSQLEVDATTVTLSDRDDFDRFDLVVVDSLGDVSSTSGDTEDRAPDLGGSETLLAVVRVPSSSSQSIEVYDARPLLDRTTFDELRARTAKAIDPRTDQEGTLFVDDLDVGEDLELPVLSADPAADDLTGAEIWINDDVDEVKYYNVEADQIETLPVFTPDDVENPILRVNMPTAGAQAFEALDPDSDQPAFEHLRFATASGVLALHDTARGDSGSSESEVIDDFEDDDLTEWSGELSYYQTVSSPVAKGSYALEGDTTSGEKHPDIHSAPGDGLDYYPGEGDIIEYRIRMDNSKGHASFEFGRDGSDFSGYQMRVNGTGFSDNSDTVRLEAPDGTVIASDTWTSSDHVDEWLRVRVEWGSDGSFSFTLYDSSDTELASASGTDSSSVGNGIHLKTDSSDETTKIYWDHIEKVGTVETASVIDDFEDGDVDEYTKDRGGSFTAQQSTVYEGTYAGKIDAVDTGSSVWISNSGLPKYPSPGTTFETRVRVASGQDGIVFFGWQDADNRYQVSANDDADEFRLYVRDGGSFTKLASETVTIPTGEWLRYRVEWGSSGDFTCTLYAADGTEVSQITASDSTHGEGGFGWGCATGTETMYYDYAVEKSSSDSGTTDPGQIDSWEDGDLSEYNGDTGSFTVTTGRSIDGSYSLRRDENGGATITSTSGLDNYPKQGATIQIRIYPENYNSTWGIYFGVQDSSDPTQGSYQASHFKNDNGISLIRYNSDGSSTELASDTFNLDSSHDQQWLEIELDWQSDGTIVYTIRDDSGNALEQISGSDSTWTDGGVAIYGNAASSSEELFFDDWKIV